MRADICPREDERIAALCAYDILVDRQWYNAEVGLGMRLINAFAAQLGERATFAGLIRALSCASGFRPSDGQSGEQMKRRAGCHFPVNPGCSNHAGLDEDQAWN